MTPDTEEGDRLAGSPHPRERFDFFGHHEVETELLTALRSGRIPHAILLAGPQGIGKATLAYRLARFLLAGADRSAKSLDIVSDHPVSRQVAALSYPDLLTLRRLPRDDGKALSEFIRVEDTRRLVQFFGSTAAYGGWRVCIIDSVDDMNAASANAMLKLLEEPPANAMLILVSHAPGRLLPTIRSRCRRVDMKPLTDGEVLRALQSVTADMEDIDPTNLGAAAEAGRGSVGRALSLLLTGEDGLEVLHMTQRLLAQLPEVESGSIAALGDKLRGDQLNVFADTVEDWLAAAATGDAPPARLARYAEAWENVRRATATADIYNLDRKPLVFQVFAVLAEATRD
ncbi:MAG TPA: DNA polymerase III subunit delta' [Xanthobacteraceae bacterium]|nr:DNA polymerase III subunit delta' [Xanthobacteraceae bacterium]